MVKRPPKKAPSVAALSVDELLNLDLEAQGDDVDEAPARAAAREKKAPGSAARHAADLQKLKQQDPAFHAFLETTDAELLAFNDSDEEEEEEEQAAPAGALASPAAGRCSLTPASADDPPDDAPAAEHAPSDAGELVLTTERVEQLCAAASESPSLASVAKLLRAFRACAHYGDQLGGDEPASGAPAAALSCQSERD
jgi:nucleolar complex protein 2